MKPTCRYVMSPNTIGSTARYCGDDVEYKMVYDGGEVGAAKVRKYNTFCRHHTSVLAERAKGEQL